MKIKLSIIARSVALLLLLILSTLVHSQSISITKPKKNSFPKPNTFNFNTKERAEIDSMLSTYVVPEKFEIDMLRFAKDDSLNARKQFDVVFTGSSSFTKWKSLDIDMSPYPALNRGFGSSKILDLVYFSDNYLYKLQPKLIFIYVEKDIPALQGNQVVLLFRYLEKVYHSKLPKTKLIFCSIKKSILRKNYWAKVEDVNNYLKTTLTKVKYCDYLELNNVLFDENGVPNSAYYLADSLHLNSKGYLKWIEVFKPSLQKEYSLITSAKIVEKFK